MENASTNEKVILKWHMGKFFFKISVKFGSNDPSKN